VGSGVSSAEGISLLAHLQTPILVGDPEGCVVYANPAFRSRFCQAGGDPMGQPLAMVFEGGAREAVLTAVAEVLEFGQSARLQLREGDCGYTGLASPIEAEDDRVGVVMVLLEEQSSEDYMGFTEGIGEPIAEAMRSLQGLSRRLDGSLDADQQASLARSLKSIETAQQRLRDLQMALRGGRPRSGRFDVGHLILRVAERVMNDTERKLEIEVLMPPNLPRVAGSPVVFERLLTQLVRQRIDEAKSDKPLTLLARALGGEQPRGVLVSLVDIPDSSRRNATGQPPEALQQGMASMDGDVVCVEDSIAGRVTSMRLAVVEP